MFMDHHRRDLKVKDDFFSHFYEANGEKQKLNPHRPTVKN
jgi:hypothetical protein